VSLHRTELANLQNTGGAAWRKYQRLMSEAQGAQHGSPADVAKLHFEHAWANDPQAVIAQAEKEEAAAAEAAAEPEVEAEEAEHGRKGSKRQLRA